MRQLFILHLPGCVVPKNPGKVTGWANFSSHGMFPCRLFPLGSILLRSWVFYILPHGIVVHSCSSRGSPIFSVFFPNLLCWQILGKIAAEPGCLLYGWESLHFPFPPPPPAVAISSPTTEGTFFVLVFNWQLSIFIISGFLSFQLSFCEKKLVLYPLW